VFLMTSTSGHLLILGVNPFCRGPLHWIHGWGGTIRPIRVDHTDFFQVDIKTHSIQRHRTRRVRVVTSQLNVPTSLTSAPSQLLRFRFVCCAKEVSDLINHPVVSLRDIRVDGTNAEVVTQRI
jgi:hypothetical protein